MLLPLPLLLLLMLMPRVTDAAVAVAMLLSSPLLHAMDCVALAGIGVAFLSFFV
jgi:hypothetical protein